MYKKLFYGSIIATIVSFIALILSIVTIIIDNKPKRTYDIYNGDLWLQKSNTESQSIILNDGKTLFEVIHYQNWDDFIVLNNSKVIYTNRFEHYYLKNITLHYQWTQKQINNYL